MMTLVPAASGPSAFHCEAALLHLLLYVGQLFTAD